MIFEILDQDGKVINTVTADSEFMLQAFPDKNYRLVIEPVIHVESPTDALEIRSIHPVALYERFTFAERVGITRAGQINSSDSPEKQTLAATVSRFERDLAVYKRHINLDGEGLTKGLALLSSIKLLEPDWMDRIVKAPITESERSYSMS